MSGCAGVGVCFSCMYWSGLVFVRMWLCMCVGLCVGMYVVVPLCICVCVCVCVCVCTRV